MRSPFDHAYTVPPTLPAFRAKRRVNAQVDAAALAIHHTMLEAQSDPPPTRPRQAQERRPRRGLPAQQTSPPRLPHRPRKRLADRDRRDRRRLPAPDQRPHGHHRRPLGPPNSRSRPEATRPDQQRRLRHLLGLSPHPRTPPRPHATLRPRCHPPIHITKSLQKTCTQKKSAIIVLEVL